MTLDTMHGDGYCGELTVGFRAAAVPTSLAPPDMMLVPLQIELEGTLPKGVFLHGGVQ